MIRQHIYWGSALAQTDVLGLWAYAKVRPRWYWLWRRLCLFCGIVWRRYDDQCGRIGLATAWEVARIVFRSKLTPGMYNQGSPGDGK